MKALSYPSDTPQALLEAVQALVAWLEGQGYQGVPTGGYA